MILCLSYVYTYINRLINGMDQHGSVILNSSKSVQFILHVILTILNLFYGLCNLWSSSVSLFMASIQRHLLSDVWFGQRGSSTTRIYIDILSLTHYCTSSNQSLIWRSILIRFRLGFNVNLSTPRASRRCIRPLCKKLLI